MSGFPGPSPRDQARDRLILALDFPSATPAHALLVDLRGVAPKWVKVGLELFLAEGPRIVHTLRSLGYSVFLDLKLHDIPNTVASAVRAIGALDVQMLTVHAAGGSAMLHAAAEAAASMPSPPRLLAVTVLTSMNAGQLAGTGVDASPQAQVLRLARTAFQAGITGLVASPLEAALLRSEFRTPTAQHPGLHLVTPGIRPAGSAPPADDQQRTATPAAALAAGAAQLVVGRPITRAADPSAAYAALLDQVEDALREPHLAPV